MAFIVLFEILEKYTQRELWEDVKKLNHARMKETHDSHQAATRVHKLDKLCKLGRLPLTSRWHLNLNIQVLQSFKFCFIQM